jgi:DNA repair ATPase RecN
MRSIKTRLTNLKNKVLDVIPEGEDVLGFPGIKKELISESITDTYQILELLSQFENRFESVLLQRRLAECIDKATEYLKEKFKNQDADDFNKFLNKIAEMHYASKETYILFSKEPIRLDAALTKAKEHLADLENQNIQIQPIIDNLTSAFNSSNSIVETLTENNKDSSKKLEEISNTFSSVINLKKKADTAATSINKIDDQVQATKIEILNYQAHISELSKKLQTTYEQLEKNKSDFETALNSLQSSITQNDIHQKSIQETIENANRLGMAASFKKRKDELSKPYWAWGIATVVTICILIITSYSVFTILKDKPFSYEYLLVRIPIFASFVWLGWFCAKQFGFVSRIREDYSYKYAVSMAFEGYKNATKEINEEMLEHLLSLTLQNISSNPLTIYETGSNHGTPVNEILSNWTKKGKVKSKKDSKNQIDELEIDNIENDNE